MSAQGELTDLLSFALLSSCLLLTPSDTHTHTDGGRNANTQTQGNTHTHIYMLSQKCDTSPKGQNSEHFCHTNAILGAPCQSELACVVYAGFVCSCGWVRAVCVFGNTTCDTPGKCRNSAQNKHSHRKQKRRTLNGEAQTHPGIRQRSQEIFTRTVVVILNVILMQIKKKNISEMNVRFCSCQKSKAQLKGQKEAAHVIETNRKPSSSHRSHCSSCVISYPEYNTLQAAL